MPPKKQRAARSTDEVDLNRFRKTLYLVEGNTNKWSSHPPQSPLAPSLQGSEPLHENQTLNVIERSDVYRFYVPKKAKVNIDKGNWYNIYTDRKNSKTGSKLKSGWSSVLAEYISSAIPTCKIMFRRHKLYKNI